jgi:hypothetical protein
MSEPKGDHAAFNASLQQIHRRRVPQNVSSHVFLFQRCAGLAGMGNMLCQQILHPVGTQTSASRTGKDYGVLVGLNLAHPTAQHIRRRLGQRR